ncbi:hypothetical protein ESB13_03570 [Filimonas effusa]|uniref:Uncharacterized protein n=1 Tax=Filimonas effusa TaxID=2508721 RepID=A0A4Q1D994_9BACT|nr:hypothetical protein ESB13_03570 [Filimonas effusa]
MGLSTKVLPEKQHSPIKGRKKAEGDLVIHGNILYNVDYRSYIDTPYAENDIYYHTIQTYLDITYKKNYPVRVYLTNRFSNSALTRDFTDLNMQFSSNEFRNKIRQTLRAYEYDLPRLTMDSLLRLQKELDLKKYELAWCKGWMKDQSTIQKLVEEKERELYGERNQRFDMPDLPLGNKTGINWSKSMDRSAFAKRLFQMPDKSELPDSLLPKDSSLAERYEANTRKLDSLQHEIKTLTTKCISLRDKLEVLRSGKNIGVDKIANIEQLEEEVRRRNVPDSALPRGYKTLWAVKSIGIGRTLVDYSELSAKNVSINGIQLEYNPGYYVAFAAGTINYRFRDFVIKRGNTPSQYLQMIRVGKGDRNGTNVITTFYSGKKQIYNNTGAQDVKSPGYQLMGFTVEGNYKLNDYTRLTVEVAKSSLPYYNQPAKKGLLSTALSFDDRSNEAYSAKIQSVIPKTNTKLSGFYKRYGENFQSFSLITTGVEQRSWMLKADQLFFGKKLNVIASLKENDYSNPAATMVYQNNIVFKTLQATLRLPHWPIVSVGYYPSSQLTKLSDDKFVENTFYSLVGNVNYYYKVHDINMNSTAVYTRFYNRQQDSAFVYFNTTNLLLNQSFFYRKLTYQATGAMAFNQEYNLYTLDNDVQYALLEWLSLGAGIKYNYQTNYNIKQLGYKGSAIIKVKKLGEFQLMLDNGFIPGAQKQLVKNKTGRFSFFKLF